MKQSDYIKRGRTVYESIRMGITTPAEIARELRECGAFRGTESSAVSEVRHIVALMIERGRVERVNGMLRVK